MNWEEMVRCRAKRCLRLTKATLERAAFWLVERWAWMHPCVQLVLRTMPSPRTRHHWAALLVVQYAAAQLHRATTVGLLASPSRHALQELVLGLHEKLLRPAAGEPNNSACACSGTKTMALACSALACSASACSAHISQASLAPLRIPEWKASSPAGKMRSPEGARLCLLQQLDQRCSQEPCCLGRRHCLGYLHLCLQTDQPHMRLHFATAMLPCPALPPLRHCC
mmetsp:Transcript_120115/g.383423  ORF Transcript_120115/g.383423 Transcript_120115/m.383423 type:complete len:225 (+) Transcript_120115:2317-2991(+)